METGPRNKAPAEEGRAQLPIGSAGAQRSPHAHAQ